MGKMRVTMHRGRVHNGGVDKGKVYLAKHNDRDFDVTNAEHIDSTKSCDNMYTLYNVIDTGAVPETFEEHELQVYQAHFGDWLVEQNARHRKKGNHNRVKTMSEVMKCKCYAPEEVIIQIGKKDDTVPRDILIAVHRDLIAWHIKRYPQFMFLDSAGHFDEEDCADHFHDRGVWIAHDDAGNEIIGQEKALTEMGYELPKPDKKMSRFNNRKITYTAEVRNKFVAICQQYGVDVEIEPQEPSKTGLSLVAYKCNQERERAKRDADAIRERAERDAEQIRKQAEEVRRRAEQERLRYEELRKNQQRYILETARKLAIDTNKEFAKLTALEQRKLLLLQMPQTDSASDDFDY